VSYCLAHGERSGRTSRFFWATLACAIRGQRDFFRDADTGANNFFKDRITDELRPIGVANTSEVIINLFDKVLIRWNREQFLPICTLVWHLPQSIHPKAKSAQIKTLAQVSILGLYSVTMKRGAVKKSESKLLTVWIPETFERPMKQAVALEDSDKSKFVRNAIREKLARHGIAVEMEAA
jgi:hypothetical protein